MNESPAPHGFYDGPIKMLAGCHLGLIRAIFFLLLAVPPVSLTSFFVGMEECSISVTRQYPATKLSYYPYAEQPAREGVEWIRANNYSASEKFVEAKVAGFSVSLGVCQTVSLAALLLACGFPLLGVGLLIYRFYRLARLLYPQLALYFTMLVLVPFLNLIVILLLLRSALRQMRDRGLRVGMFGIDPARFG
jgi:hypothetical protein